MKQRLREVLAPPQDASAPQSDQSQGHPTSKTEEGGVKPSSPETNREASTQPKAAAKGKQKPKAKTKPKAKPKAEPPTDMFCGLDAPSIFEEAEDAVMLAVSDSE